MLYYLASLKKMKERARFIVPTNYFQTRFENRRYN